VTAEKTGDPSGGSVRGGGLFFFLFRLIQPVAWESGRPAPDGAGRNGTKFFKIRSMIDCISQEPSKLAHDFSKIHPDQTLLPCYLLYFLFTFTL